MPEHRRAVRNAAITFAVGAALALIIGAVTLAQAPSRLVLLGAPGIPGVGPKGASLVEHTIGDPTVCQDGEVLPSGVSAIRLSLWGFFGARVRVAVYEGSQLLTEGSRAADWTSDSVTVPVKPVARTAYGTTVCFKIGPNSEPINILGPATPPTEAATISEAGHLHGRAVPLHGRVAVEYVAPGSGSWWSRILSVAHHLGLGRSFSGTWIAFLVAALVLATGALAVRLTLREISS